MSPKELREKWKTKVAAGIDALTDEMVLALHGDQYEIEAHWHRPKAAAREGSGEGVGMTYDTGNSSHPLTAKQAAKMLADLRVRVKADLAQAAADEQRWSEIQRELIVFHEKYNTGQALSPLKPRQFQYIVQSKGRDAGARIAERAVLIGDDRDLEDAAIDADNLTVPPEEEMPF